jgi:hypothetical protein
MMIAKFISAVRYLSRRDPPGVLLKVWPNDIFLVSYPKSGNTWLRFLVANLLQQGPPVGLRDADRMIPSVDGRSKKFFSEMSPPRVIKSHYCFQPAYRRMIYVVRDPRDVAVSQFYYQIKRGVLEPGASIEPFTSKFLAGEVCPYGSWGENVASWLATHRHDPNFLLVRYEDMLAQILPIATSITRFLMLPEDPARIALAIQRSSLEAMRKLEKAESKQWESTKGTRQDLSFFRAGKTGEGRATLPRECVERIEKAWGPLMNSLNYSLTTTQEAAALASAGMPI